MTCQQVEENSQLATILWWAEPGWGWPQASNAISSRRSHQIKFKGLISDQVKFWCCWVNIKVDSFWRKKQLQKIQCKMNITPKYLSDMNMQSSGLDDKPLRNFQRPRHWARWSHWLSCWASIIPFNSVRTFIWSSLVGTPANPPTAPFYEKLIARCTGRPYCRFLTIQRPILMSECSLPGTRQMRTIFVGIFTTKHFATYFNININLASWVLSPRN